MAVSRSWVKSSYRKQGQQQRAGAEERIRSLQRPPDQIKSRKCFGRRIHTVSEHHSISSLHSHQFPLMPYKNRHQTDTKEAHSATMGPEGLSNGSSRDHSCHLWIRRQMSDIIIIRVPISSGSVGARGSQLITDAGGRRLSIATAGIQRRVEATRSSQRAKEHPLLTARG